MRTTHLPVLLLALLTTLPAKADAGAGTHAPADAVLATVGDTVITAECLRREMTRRGGGTPGRYETAEARQALLDEMVQHRLRVTAARAEGYAERPEVVAALEGLMAAAWERDRLEPKLESVEVGAEEIAAHHAAHAARYTEPEQVRVALIHLDAASDSETIRNAEAQILDAASAIDPAQGFGDLARRYSFDRASRYVGGVVGWLVRGDRYRWPDAVVDAAFALTSAGDVAVVPTEGGRFLVRLVARRPATLRPLESVSDGIRRELVRTEREALRQAFFDNLARQFAVEIDSTAVEHLAPPTNPAPPPVPGRSASSQADEK